MGLWCRYGTRQNNRTPTFRTFFWNAFAVQLLRKSEGFFRRVIGAYTHKFSEMQCSFAYGSSGAAFVSSRAVFVRQRSIATEMIPANMHDFYRHVSYHLFEVYSQSFSIACKLCMYLYYILACWSMLQDVIDTHIFLYGHTYTRISWITGFLNVPFQWRFAIVQTIQPFHYLSEGESWGGNN